MSPEQCLGAAIDHRSDIFALGVVLYELTLGARCFHGKSDFERMLAVVKACYTPPRELDPDYPPALEHVVRTALAHDPGDRFASAAAMIEALEEVAIAAGWIGGAGAICRLMRGLFGERHEPRASHPDDAAVTEPHAFVPVPAWLADDLDDRTHGRGPLRRPSRPRIAA
jgi:serine/threonine-protein kinase